MVSSREVSALEEVVVEKWSQEEHVTSEKEGGRKEVGEWVSELNPNSREDVPEHHQEDEDLGVGYEPEDVSLLGP